MDVIQTLTNVLNALLTIETKGQNSITLVEAETALSQVIQELKKEPEDNDTPQLEEIGVVE